MVFHLRYDDFVALLHLALAERTGHQVNGLRSATRKHDFLRLAGVDKLAHFFAGRLVQIGSLLTQVVYTTMYIGIHVQVFVPHRIQHHQRLLRRCRIVQIHQWLAVNLTT